MLAKQNAGNLNDLLPVCSSLLPRHFHRLIPSLKNTYLTSIYDVRHEWLYMTIVMNNKFEKLEKRPKGNGMRDKQMTEAPSAKGIAPLRKTLALLNSFLTKL